MSAEIKIHELLKTAIRGCAARCAEGLRPSDKT
jgi:hypothetical protein